MARRSDILKILPLARSMHEEGAFETLQFSLRDCARLGEKYIQSPNNFFMVAEDDGKPVGFFMGYLSKYFFGPEKIASELVWYVLPNKRGSMAGVRMLTAFRRWAKTKGAAEICIGISNGVNTHRTEKLLGRMGFHRAGGIWKEAINV